MTLLGHECRAWTGGDRPIPYAKMTEHQRALEVLSLLLKSLGFDAMARDVLSETDDKRIALYVAIILKQSPDHLKGKAQELLAKAGIIRGSGFWVKGN